MALKTFNPKTPTSRHTVLVDKSELFKGSSVKSLTKAIKKNSGRNNSGKITVRHRGGGMKTKYREIDFARNKFDITAKIEAVEYDPNRTAFIALVVYADGERNYIIAPEGLKAGDTVVSGVEVPIEVGNRMPLNKIPQGALVHAVELWPGKGAQLARSAGSSLQVMGKNKNYIQLKMPSGELRLVNENCYATLGAPSNIDHKNEKLGSAGRSRMRGIRPTVRGVAMSYKHPHAAGQGKKGKGIIGGPAQDPWGNRIGKRTRKHKSTTSKFIVRRRPSKHKFKNYKTIV